MFYTAAFIPAGEIDDLALMWEIYYDIYLHLCSGNYYLNEKLNAKVVKGTTCKRSIKS